MKKVYLKWGAAALLIAAVLVFLIFHGSFAGREKSAEKDAFRLGTFVRIRLYGDDEDFLSAALVSGDAEIVRLEGLLSANLPGSDISRINNAGGKFVKVERETAEVVSRAVDICKKSGGAFDPTLGALSSLWRIGTESARVPSRSEAEAAAATHDIDKVSVEKRTDGWYVKCGEGQRLDLGAIAKGYIGGMLHDYFKKIGVKRGIIDLGGNITAIGGGISGEPWHFGIQHPKKKRGEYFGVVSAPEDYSVVTSGPYERFFESGGRRYHHIFDPKTGFPAESDLASVSIAERDPALADALCTALFVMGSEKALCFLSENNNIAAVLVTNDNNVIVTPAASALFRLTDNDFRLSDSGEK